MGIPNTRDRKVLPTHPGEMLREDLMPDYGLTVSSIAKALGVSRQTVNELLRERRAVSPEMALRLSRLSLTYSKSSISNNCPVIN
jgi:addiction module HigA family antidote